MKAYPKAITERVWDLTTGAPPDDYLPYFETEIDGICGDALICSGYGRTISEKTLRRFWIGAFNAHPSLLPSYRGRHAIQWAISQGEKILEVTVHRMTHTVDEGDILLFRGKTYGLEKSYVDIASDLCHVAGEMLVEFL